MTDKKDALYGAVIKHALKDKENFEIAMAISECSKEIQGAPIKAFLKQLTKELVNFASENDWECLKYWHGKALEEDPFENNLPIILRGKSWWKHSGIALERESNKMFFGFKAPTKDTWQYKDEEKFGRPEETNMRFLESEELRVKIRTELSTIITKFSKYKPYPWWPAWCWLEDLVHKNLTPQFFYKQQCDGKSGWKKEPSEITKNVAELFKRCAEKVDKLIMVNPRS